MRSKLKHLSASPGSPVHAADTGVVVFAGWSDIGYGNAVLIDHGNGFRTLYAQLSQVSIFPTPEAARKLLFLANRDILKKWTMPIYNWPLILNQLVIRFEGRLAV